MLDTTDIKDDPGTHDVFGQDSVDPSCYDVLRRSVTEVLNNNVPGLFMEIGTRRGGSAKVVMDTIIQHYASIAKRIAYERTYILCDPYGNVPYNACEVDGRMGVRIDYHNQMRDQCIPHILQYGWQHEINMLFMNMEDSEFFHRYDDGVPVYYQEKRLDTHFAFVFVDGPHDLESVEIAAQFFCHRMPVGSHIVFDNIPYYDHGPVHTRMIRHGYEQVDQAWEKIAYERKSVPYAEILADIDS